MLSPQLAGDPSRALPASGSLPTPSAQHAACAEQVPNARSANEGKDCFLDWGVKGVGGKEVRIFNL